MIDFKVGGFYRRRDGKKAECLKIDCVGKWPILLILVNDDSTWTSFVDIAGYYYEPAKEDVSDIIGVWEDPKPRRLCYRTAHYGTLKMLTAVEFLNFKESTLGDVLERYPCSLDEI